MSKESCDHKQWVMTTGSDSVRYDGGDVLSYLLEVTYSKIRVVCMQLDETHSRHLLFSSNRLYNYGLSIDVFRAFTLFYTSTWQKEGRIVSINTIVGLNRFIIKCLLCPSAPSPGRVGNYNQLPILPKSLCFN